LNGPIAAEETPTNPPSSANSLYGSSPVPFFDD
jgi:hypothetical protein